MTPDYIVVEGFAATAADETNLKDESWALALDQRAFGPRRLVVAFADADGGLRALAHAPQTEPPIDALDACIRSLGLGSAMAIAYSDEAVSDGPAPADVLERFRAARELAAESRVHLVDWITCDDQLFRSCALAADPPDDYWEVSAS